LRIFVALLAASVLAPAIGQAQPAPRADEPEKKDDSKKEEARTHFERAITLFEDGAWDAALVEFLKSRELYATRAATKDAAICLRKLHRFDEALDMFETLLREFPNLPPEDRALAEQEVQALRGLVGTIVVRGSEGATVAVDDRARGTTPTPRIRVAAGSHTVRVYKEGFEPFETRVNVTGGSEQAVDARLTALRQSGRLRVSEQSNKVLDVVVDRVVVGKTPWEGSLPPGQHVVVLRGEGNLGTAPASAPVRINELTPLTLVAEVLDAQVRVEPVPISARVAIDGIATGRGVFEGRLRAGAHRIEVADDGFLTQLRNVTLRSGTVTPVVVQLERDPSSAEFRAAHPSKIVFEASGGVALSPSFGGEALEKCAGACSTSGPLGGAADLHAGYMFYGGLGLHLGVGYMTIAEGLEARPTTTKTIGFGDKAQTVDDDLTLRGLKLTAGVSYRHASRFPWMLRLEAGALLGSVKDERRGQLASANPAVPPQSLPFDATESAAAAYLLVAPEGRVGYAITPALEINLGVSFALLGAVQEAKWNAGRRLVSPTDGVLTFPAESLVGSVLFVVVPGIGMRLEL
jgi:hypothetical protein